MRHYPIALTLIAGLVVAACGCKPSTSNAGTASASTDATPSQTSSSSPSTSGSPSKPSGPDAAASGAQPVAPAAASGQASNVPAGVKTEAFDYTGLGNPSVLSFKRTMPGQTAEGTLEVKLKAVKGDKAVFEETYSGDLSDLGTQELTATPTGVYITAAFGHSFAKPQLQLPAKPAPGAKWTFQTDLTTPAGAKVFSSGSDTVVGIQSVKIGGTTYQALVVKEVGLYKGATSAHYTGTTWLVKGKGAVKEEIVTRPDKGSQSTMTLEATG